MLILLLPGSWKSYIHLSNWEEVQVDKQLHQLFFKSEKDQNNVEIVSDPTVEQLFVDEKVEGIVTPSNRCEVQNLLYAGIFIFC